MRRACKGKPQQGPRDTPKHRSSLRIAADFKCRDSRSIFFGFFVSDGKLFDQFEGVLDQDFAGHFAERRLGDVFVALEAVEVDFGEDVAEGVVREAEEQVVLSLHVPLEVVADVRQGFAGDGEDLGVADVDQVHARGDRLVVVVRVFQRRTQDDRPHQAEATGNFTSRA